MKTKLSIPPILVAAFLSIQPSLSAQDTTRPDTLPEDPGKAWSEVEKVHVALRPPDDWRSAKPSPEQVAEFQMQVRRAEMSTTPGSPSSSR